MFSVYGIVKLKHFWINFNYLFSYSDSNVRKNQKQQIDKLFFADLYNLKNLQF